MEDRIPVYTKVEYGLDNRTKLMISVLVDGDVLNENIGIEKRYDLIDHIVKNVRAELINQTRGR